MPIHPLPVIEEEDEAERKALERLKPPESIVVRFGHMRQIGEFPYEGEEIPGCGTKLVVRTPRGVELAEMLTTTCANGGCGHSITRQQMLEYIEESGGKQFPFTQEGKVLRLATADDVREQSRLDADKPRAISACKRLIRELDLPMKLVDVEMLLGGERIIFYFTSEGRVDFRELVRQLAGEFHTRIEMRQVGARDEARLVADYEKCGQHCCCRQFLKVLKPVSMRNAKIQKATLDPAKISGRCGRLMCCLRYEEVTYDDLRKRLPNRNTRMLTEDGPGRVIDTQILTQLVLIELDAGQTRNAYAVEDIQKMTKEDEARYAAEAEQRAKEQADRQARRERSSSRRSRPQRDDRAEAPAQDRKPTAPPEADASGADTGGDDASDKPSNEQSGDAPKRKRRRRRRGRRRNRGGNGEDASGSGGGTDSG